MVRELKQHIEKGMVYFGIRQTLKNGSKVGKAFVSSNCREQIRNLLDVNKIEVEELDYSKNELRDHLGINFDCEVFGVRK
jgi:ribosomal protein L30E